MNCPLPQGKTGKHVIYNVWQRSDSQEAFYACIDVSFSGAVANPGKRWATCARSRTLPAGATVTLRLFDAQGRDAQRHSLTLAQGANGAKQWPLALAQKVNQDSTLVNIGVLDAYGAVSPVASSQDNQVYVRQAGYRSRSTSNCRSGRRRATGRRRQGRLRLSARPAAIRRRDRSARCRWQALPVQALPELRLVQGLGLYYAPGKGMAWQDAWTPAVTPSMKRRTENEGYSLKAGA